MPASVITDRQLAGFTANESAERFGGGRRWVHAELGETLFHRREVQGLLTGGVEFGNDIRRRASRRSEAIPSPGLKISYATIRTGRKLRKTRRPCIRC